MMVPNNENVKNSNAYNRDGDDSIIIVTTTSATGDEWKIILE